MSKVFLIGKKKFAVGNGSYIFIIFNQMVQFLSCWTGAASLPISEHLTHSEIDLLRLETEKLKINAAVLSGPIFSLPDDILGMLFII